MNRFTPRTSFSNAAIPLLIASCLAPSLVAQGLPPKGPAPGPSLAEIQRAFEKPPDDSRILMRWWWFGPAVTKPELEREMRAMKEAGIGGFEVQPVYPVALDDDSAGIKTLPFLSDPFLDALRFAADKGRELGLRVDLTIGSGWPYGGPQVPLRQASSMLRVDRVKVPDGQTRVAIPDIGAGEKLIAVFLARSTGPALAAESLREVTDLADGAVRVPESAEGPRELLFFVASRTGMMVKRPAVGAEGFVLDHYDRAAVDGYLKNVGDRLLQAFPSHPPYSIFCDSLEAYGSDWTGDLLPEFQRRRGYDLRPLLPALVVDVGPQAAGIRNDWGKTLTELLGDRFLAPMRDWARRNGTRFRIQAYGIPPATLSSNAYADLPEGEGYQWKTLRATRWATSASHIYGRPVTSSETWTWLHSPSFRATPLDLKAEADLHFLQGVNQLIGHGWPYSAEGAGYPGWRLYAAGAFSDKNPWWIVMPDVSRYLQRMSFLLRQGQPENDVAVYLPNDDAWARFTAGNVHMIDVLAERLGPNVVAKVLEAGYGFDFFDDAALAEAGRVERGALALGPNRYRLVILPGVERIPLASLQKLEDLARGGGGLIATRRTPSLAPGHLANDEDHARIKDISDRLFKKPLATTRFLEDENGLGAALSSLLGPDVSLSPAAPEIGFVHRRTAEAEVYFLANTANVRQSVSATFRVEATHAEWWDPMTGAVSPAAVRGHSKGGPTLALDLPPYGSRVYVFSRRALPQAPATRATANGPAPVDLSAGWRVSFGPGQKPVSLEHLRSWTEEEASRYFSGVATYEKEFEVPRAMLEARTGLELSLGDGQPIPSPGPKARMRAWLEGPVREAAVVFVNGERAGSVWCPPYSLDITGRLRSGPNTLRIDVGNLAINHMSGRSQPDYRLLNLRYGVRFEPQDMANLLPLPSGLLGPVMLRVAR